MKNIFKLSILSLGLLFGMQSYASNAASSSNGGYSSESDRLEQQLKLFQREILALSKKLANADDPDEKIAILRHIQCINAIEVNLNHGLLH